MQELEDMSGWKISGLIMVGIFSFLVLLSGLWGLSALHARYGIWRETQHGLAELARAQNQRQIAVVEAEAAKDSAIQHAEAEVIRAAGVAEANKIIGDSLKGNESYLRYRWIEGLQSNKMSIIYVPTEANLPILEANRLAPQE